MAANKIGFNFTTLALGLIATIVGAKAQDVDRFYRGRQIELVVGGDVGTSYDSYARLMAKYMPGYIPGNPSIVVRAMPGAGHIKAANYLYTVAPRDGSTIGIIAPAIPTASVLRTKPALEADFANFYWIGSTDTVNQVCVARPDVQVKKAADLFTKTLIVGGAGSGSGVSMVPTYLRDIFGMKFDLIEGYKSAGEVILAMDRHEVEGICQTYQGVEHTRPGWISEGKFNLLFNLEKKPMPGSRAPSIHQMLQDPTQIQIAEFFSANNDLGRPVITPPNIPEDRLKALRQAFDLAVRDPGYVADATRQHLDNTPTTGLEQEILFRQILETPPEIIGKVAKYLR